MNMDSLSGQVKTKDDQEFGAQLERLAEKIHVVRKMPIENRGPTGESECE